jgi:hypothetical protein
MNRFLLVIIATTGVSFAPTTFADEASCKATARTIAEKAVDAISRGGGVTIACVPVAADPRP